MSKKPDWMNDTAFDVDPVVIFKNEPVHFLTFLNEGVGSTTKLTDETTGKEKEVPCVEYKVLEKGKEIKFNPIAKTFISQLKELYPLTNREFRIELIKGRTQVENSYEITEMNKE